MRSKCRVVWAVVLTGAIVFGGTQTIAAEAASVPKLKSKKLTIAKGSTKKILIKGKRMKSKKFKTTKKTIATVSKKGKVKAKKVGSCKIKITVRYRKTKRAKKLSTKKLTCQIKVTQNGTPKPTRQPDLKVTAAFTRQVANTSVNLMKQSTAGDLKNKKNVLVSPESVLTAMAMVINGAKGETLAELQKTLYGDLSVEEFNQNMSTYNDYLTLSEDVKFHQANAVWIRNDANQISVLADFLNTNSKYFHAKAYLEPFDQTTVKKMNDWVKTNTKGMIPNIIEKIPKEARMYLMNALAFEGRWASQYSGYQVQKGTFTTAAGEKQSVSMLNSTEHSYLQDAQATGVMKYYEGNDYAFAAILPNPGISLTDYLTGLTGEDFVKLIQSAQNKRVNTKIPEFSYDYDTDLKTALQAMGIGKAFTSSADFGNMAATKDGILYIDSVIHKTHIELDRNGTKAAAVTSIGMAGAAAPTEPPKQVYLDRPFLYAIVEADTGLPIFMGAVNSVS